TARTYCAAVKAKGGAAGAPQTVAALSDPAQALGEQFCMAEAEATAQGIELAKGFTGFTPEQIAAQCRDFGALLADQVALLGTTPRDDMVASVQGWGAQSGMTEAQLAGTAKVCLSMGYSTDDMGVALGSALVLTGAGNMTYAEFLGHHLAGGVGIEAHPELAVDWYDLAANAAAIGQTPVFGAATPERGALIHKAAMALAGRSEAVPAVAPVPVSAPVLEQGGAASGLAGFGAAAAQLMQQPKGN
ncbi:MAG: peptidoglycan-binding protein, partial [Sphingomonadales bacterium]|nr:peptidoglycan-binding protein [Sphingomonadales bacterium]